MTPTSYERFCAFYSPEREWVRGLDYANHPVMSRITAYSVTTLMALGKTLLFPLWTLVACVAFPVLTLLSALRFEGREAASYLGAFGFSVLAAAGTTLYLGVTAFQMSLLASSALTVGIVSFNICMHTHRTTQDIRLVEQANARMTP